MCLLIKNLQNDEIYFFRLRESTGTTAKSKSTSHTHIPFTHKTTNKQQINNHQFTCMETFSMGFWSNILLGIMHLAISSCMLRLDALEGSL